MSDVMVQSRPEPVHLFLCQENTKGDINARANNNNTCYLWGLNVTNVLKSV